MKDRIYVAVTPKRQDGMYVHDMETRQPIADADHMQQAIGYATMDAISNVRRTGGNLADYTYVVSFALEE